MSVDKIKNLLKTYPTPIIWKKTEDVLYPYATKLDELVIRLRINDFPDEPLFTVMHGDMVVFHTNDKPTGGTGEMHIADWVYKPPTTVFVADGPVLTNESPVK